MATITTACKRYQQADRNVDGLISAGLILCPFLAFTAWSILSKIFSVFF